MTNTLALGRVLYTQYVYLFQAAGLVLLTAMIGAIMLTLRHKVGVKRQNVRSRMRGRRPRRSRFARFPRGKAFETGHCKLARGAPERNP